MRIITGKTQKEVIKKILGAAVALITLYLYLKS